MTDAPDYPQKQMTAALYVGYAAVVLMMSCLGWVIYQILSWILPDTRFNLIVPFEIFVAIEAVITTRSMISIEAYTLPWLSRRGVEWIVLIVLAKLLTYASTGIHRLAADLLVWDEHFDTFFTLEFMTIVVITTIVWVLTCHFAAQLIQLFGSPENLDLELKGIGLVDRRSIQQRLTTLIFLVGGFMLATITTLFLVPNALPAPIQASKVPYWSVMMYFVGGLALLAASNLFSLRSRWYLNGIRSSPTIWLRWIFFSFILIAAAAGLANILPTRYSFGILGTLQTAIEYVIYAITALEFLIFTPLIFLLNFVINLFGGAPVKVQQPVSPQALPPPASSQGLSHAPWLDLLRSLLFWTVFFSIIFIAFRAYFRQNREVVDVLRKQPYLKWLFDLWGWLKRLFSRAGAWTQTAIAAGRAGLIRTRRNAIIRLPRAAPVLDKLPPGQKIRLIYLIMTEWIATSGYPRQKQESPAEYAQKLYGIYPDSTADIQRLTDLFISARYSRQQMTYQEAEAAKTCWNSLQTALEKATATDRAE